MKNIGILGYGNVGRATAKYLEDSERQIVVYDEDKAVEKAANKEHKVSDTLLKYSGLDALLVCIHVPNPMACDLRYTVYFEVVAQHLCDSMLDVHHLLLEGAPIIIRTTVPPGTCDALQRLLPNNPVLAWPEFAKEASMRENYELKAPYLGLPPESFDEDVGDGREVASLILGPCELSGELCSSNVYQNKQVEFMKLAWNVRRAVDVTVFNQMTHAAVGLGFDQYVAEHLVEQARPTAPQFSTLASGGACLDKDLSIWDASFNETLGMMVRTINRTGPLRALQMAYKAAEMLDLDEQRPVILGLQDGPGSRSTVHSPALQFMKLRKWESAPIFVDPMKTIQDRFKWLLKRAGHEDRASVLSPDSTVLCRTNLIIVAQKSHDNSVLNALLTVLRTSEAPVKVVVNAAGVYMDEKSIIDCIKLGAVFIDKQELVRMTKK